MLGSDNVFRDLGFPEAEAQNLLLRADLVIHIRKVIEKLGITQAEAAKRVGITQPRMNDLVKNHTHKFTLEALVNVAASLGYSVQLKLKKAAELGRSKAHPGADGKDFLENLNPNSLSVVTAYVEPSLASVEAVSVFSLSGMGTLSLT